MWAGPDGSFPGVSGNGSAAAAAAEGVEAVLASGERGAMDGVGDACTDWDAGILMAAAGERPVPTAPPPFLSTLELQAEPGADDGEHSLSLS